MNRREIADILDEIAVLLELKGENPFKCRAYQAGARAVEGLEEDLGGLIEEDRLRRVKGIGEALAKKIEELHRTGRLVFYEELHASIEPGLVQMLEIPGLGPKKIRALYEKLRIASIDDLDQACRDGKVAELDGFGEKSQQKILTGIQNRNLYSRRHLWWKARAQADPILEGLRSLPEVVRAEHAGSLRRGLETVGDLDFIVAAEDAEPVMDWFTTRPDVREITAQGETKASVRLENGLQADLRIVPEEQFFFALHHFTGSKDHNVGMRQRALSRGLSLSEWGLTPVKESDATKPVRAKSEKDIFKALGLAEIPPPLREGRGEIELAEAGELPRLVELKDIRGAFHNHTTASDGHNSLEEMAAAAAERGWDYFGVADHSKASFQARGLTEKRLREQIEAVRRYNADPDRKIRIFSGTECDILPDGRLDFVDDVLSELDYVVISVHSAFSQSEEDMTRRIIRAMENPRVTMLGHPTGRLLQWREGYAVDLPKIIDAAAANRVIIELNANPHRLDLDWRFWRRAIDKGVRCAINPDAHEIDALDHMEAGINAARKGWLTADLVLNTWPLQDVEDFLKTPREKRW